MNKKYILALLLLLVFVVLITQPSFIVNHYIAENNQTDSCFTGYRVIESVPPVLSKCN